MKLLLALDLTDDPDAVLARATGWVERLDAVLDLVYVDAYEDFEPDLRDPALVLRVRGELAEMHQQRMDELHRLLCTLPAERRGRGIVTGGEAATTLAQLAGDYDALLIATHGRQGLKRLWMGSVAERAVRAAGVPVLVLPLHAADPAAQAGPATPTDPAETPS